MMTRQMLSTVSRRQDTFVAIDQPAHHVRLRAPGGRRNLTPCVFLVAIRRSMISAALHQEPVHRLIDAVDLAPQLRSAKVSQCGEASSWCFFVLAIDPSAGRGIDRWGNG
jgi:hypothetical protein